jgi:hypothetical protein
MTTILKSNIGSLYRLLITKYALLLNVKYLKLQLKIIITIYMYDKEEAKENPMFYINRNVLDIFNKYMRFIELDFYYFKNALNENDEIMFVSDDDELNCSQENIFYKLLEKYKKKQIFEANTDIVRCVRPSMKQDLEFIRLYMKPHVNYANPLSNKIFDTIISTVHFDNEKIKIIKKSVMDEFALKMFSMTITNNISTYSSKTTTNELSYNSANKLKERIELLNEFSQNTTELSNLIYTVKNNSFTISKMLEKEKSNSYKKTYCKFTILLNVEELVKKLNEDILSVIKSFVGDELIEKTRRLFIKQKHLSQPHLSIRQLLKTMTHAELFAFCKNNLCLSFDFFQFENENGEIVNNENLFLSEYEVCLCRSVYGTNFEFFKKKRIIKEIMKFTRVIENFEFQREVFFVSRIFEQTRKDKLMRTRHNIEY